MRRNSKDPLPSKPQRRQKQIGLLGEEVGLSDAEFGDWEKLDANARARKTHLAGTNTDKVLTAGIESRCWFLNYLQTREHSVLFQPDTSCVTCIRHFQHLAKIHFLGAFGADPRNCYGDKPRGG